MPTLIIGDIHGCWQELQALLDKAGLGANDPILALGDIVDRGPETPQVFDFFSTNVNAGSVKGNHERKHVRSFRGEIQPSLSQRISRIQLADAYPGAVEWMSALPGYLDLPDAILVHGFLEPGTALVDQKPAVLCGAMAGQRFLNEHYDRPWYELYTGEKPVIVGHLNYTGTDQAFIYKDRVFGLDTDCVTGGSLSGILLPSFRILSVPSRGNLWGQVRREYRLGRKPVKTRSTPEWPGQYDAALLELINKVKAIHESIFSRLERVPGYDQLKPRQQAKMYAGAVGNGPAAGLLHLARLGRLDPASAKKVLREPSRIEESAREVEQL